jgi:hypothetical protein
MPGDAAEIEVHGLPQLTASLGQLKRDLPDVAPPEAAQIIGTAAKSRAPRRTGRLASSFSSSAGNGRVSISFGAPYAGPINFGVGPRAGLRGPHNIAATRFLTGAIGDKKAAWVKAYSDAIQDEVNDVKGA